MVSTGGRKRHTCCSSNLRMWDFQGSSSILVTLPILGILLNGAILDSATRRCYWCVLLSELLSAVFLQVPRERAQPLPAMLPGLPKLLHGLAVLEVHVIKATHFGQHILESTNDEREEYEACGAP